ncbi:DUF1837 domain-containing protein [Flavobacterium alkalisoli]|uniref:DUF1837 domain-containing protein n=1 Tax=Flavobacterium alkalisoli TaxID=2602769 RepID=A0A5B9FXQ8_9FLAO|nr:DUF1837 domain-containing protein [Flavobacterium alkalisoli]QEE51169.1 DUF1837 domain-containing protein [Flavobacterium alkalisoli]
MAKPFESDLVLNEHIKESNLRVYHVGFEANKFRLTPLVEVIRKVIPEFAFGYHAGMSIPYTEVIERIVEAANTVYLTDKYQKRGEFGELILHLLLRDFCNTIPLVSKIYFKDAHNATVHGFDGIHITDDGSTKKLWLGESKLYKDGIEGVKELAKDVLNHVKGDYLKKEFELIRRKIPQEIPDIEYWLDLMHKHKNLDKVFDSIIIPLVCTYSSPIFKDHNDNTEEYFDAIEKECRALFDTFNKKVETEVDLLLFLLPVPDKDDLNNELDQKLKYMQKI